ncbi:unnamed protein product [Phytomonas sp. EM1]|nr:unnamed protein product [Phytomonas sp. EM1]|eukprot:CCW65629.1 unnamed protein product [Phytomonas sp. isolate EM1]
MTDFTNVSTDFYPNIWSSQQPMEAFTLLKADPVQTFPLLSEHHYWVPMTMPIPTPVMMTSATAGVGTQMFSQGLCMDPTLLMPIPMGLFSQLPPTQSRLPSYSHTSPQAPQLSRILGPIDSSVESCASLVPPQRHMDIIPSNGSMLMTEPIMLCPPSVRKNGLLYATNTQYEGRVKRYSHLRGFGFLTATHRLTPLNMEDVSGLEQHKDAWKGVTDSPPTDPTEEVAEIDGVRYLRKPVRIGDIFVHHQKIRIPLGMDRPNGLSQDFTVGACVYFRADKCAYPGSLQAVDVRLLLRQGRVLEGGASSLLSAQNPSPIGPNPRLRPAPHTPCRRESNCSWESSELEFVSKHSLPSGQSNGGTSISKLSTLGDSDGVGHRVVSAMGILDMLLPTKSEQIGDERSSLIVSPNTCNTDFTSLLTSKGPTSYVFNGVA